MVTEEAPPDADRERDERPGRVGETGEQHDRLRADSERDGDHGGCGGVQEEERADDVDAVEVVEPEVEVKRAGGGDERGCSDTCERLLHHRGVRATGPRGFPR